jgi:hypothetical protein
VDSTEDLRNAGQTKSASAFELQSMVEALTGALKQVRSCVPHHRLQNMIAGAQHQEPARGMAVELAIAQQTLRINEPKARNELEQGLTQSSKMNTTMPF